MSYSKKTRITTAQLIEAHAAHGNDFISFDFDNARKFKAFAQYIDIDIKMANGDIKKISSWQMDKDGVVVGSRLRKPEQRKYEAIRLGIRLMDDNGVENENMKAMRLLSEAFEEKMNQLKNDKVITDDDRAPRKQADGTMRPFHLISTKIVTPMQTTAKDKEGDIVDLDNPTFWISIGKKKFFNDRETKHVSTHYDDKYYMDDSGQPDLERPVMTHEYAPTFINVHDFYHHRQTGKKIYNRLGDKDEQGNIILNNTNIQNYLTSGSAITGGLKFELTVSGRQCKLDISLYGMNYVMVAENSDLNGMEQDNEMIGEFSAKYANIAGNKTENNDQIEFEEEDFADED